MTFHVVPKMLFHYEVNNKLKSYTYLESKIKIPE